MGSDNTARRSRDRTRSLSAAVLLVLLALCWPAATALADTTTAPPADSSTATQPTGSGDPTTTDPATDPNAGAPAPDPNAGNPATDPGTTTDPNAGAPAPDPNAGAPAPDPNGAPAPDPGATPPATDPATDPADSVVTDPTATDPAVTPPVDPSSQLALTDPAAGDQWQLPAHPEGDNHPPATTTPTPAAATPVVVPTPVTADSTPVLPSDSMSFSGPDPASGARGPPFAIVLSHKDGPVLPSAIDAALASSSAPRPPTALPPVVGIAPAGPRSHHSDSDSCKRAHPPLRPIVRTPPPEPTTPPTAPMGASGVASGSGSAAGPQLALLLGLLCLASMLGASTVRRSQVLPVRGLRLGGALSRAPPAV
jgi:hypothetical protein